MKTNQIMTRKMGEFTVTQRTSDSMFNATELLKQWNSSCKSQKRIEDFFRLSATKEFIEALKVDTGIPACKNDQIYIISKARSDRGGGTWLNPLLFIDFAMWLNPTFKVQVFKFVYDEMIKYRNDAGDAYRTLSTSVAKIVSKSFIPVAMQKVGEALNWIIFNSHEKMIRNKNGDEIKQRELYELEKRYQNL